MLLLQVILEILVAQKTHAMLRKVCHTQVAALVAHCDRLSVRVILILQKFENCEETFEKSTKRPEI